MTIAPLHNASAASIAELCKQYHVRELAVFGSTARGTASKDSDVDIFVEFEPGYHPGLGWFDLEEYLESLIGHRVDLSQKSLLKPRIKIEALREAVLLYAA